MAKADIKVLVDWNNDGNYAHAQSDITDDVINVSWSRGRNYASQLSGNSVAGNLSATLYNTSGKYLVELILLFHILFQSSLLIRILCGLADLRK